MFVESNHLTVQRRKNSHTKFSIFHILPSLYDNSTLLDDASFCSPVHAVPHGSTDDFLPPLSVFDYLRKLDTSSNKRDKNDKNTNF